MATAPPTRFELELEFVTMLASPSYLTHLATSKVLQDPEFVRYLDYLQYWNKEPYIQYLSYPGPTLRVLELLQQDTFRREILKPDVGARLAEELMNGAVRG